MTGKKIVIINDSGESTPHCSNAKSRELVMNYKYLCRNVKQIFVQN